MKNAKNLVRCNNCSALYDKTLKWVRGYYEGTSSIFVSTETVRDNSCPVCGDVGK